MAQRSPSLRTKNLSSWNSGVIRTRRRMNRSTGLRSGLTPISLLRSSLIPVNTRNAPNTKIIQWKLSRSAAPAKMKIARKTSAPSTPQNNTRCWYRTGTAKNENSNANTKRLSTDRLFSISQPA